MSFRKLAITIAVVGALGFVACSGQPPLAPGAASVGLDSQAARRTQSVPGTYALGFFQSVRGVLQPVSSLPLGAGELILGAHVYVEGHPELPAQDGAVTFEYCSLKGGPANDPTRIDEAPLEACAGGSASWARLTTVNVDSAGKAYMNFGVVRFTPTIGFRFRFSEQRSGILSGISEPANFNWF